MHARNLESARALTGRAMEAVWLLTVFLVPLAFAPPQWLQAYIQLPKVVLLRVLVGVLAVVWVFHWAVAPSQAGRRGTLHTLSSHGPGRWVLAAATAFMAANVLGTLLSASPRISLWGKVPAQDGYGLYAMACYFTLFLAIATNLRTDAQLTRLLGVVAASGAIAGVLGILQYSGLGLTDIGYSGTARVSSTFGNPIFFGAALVITAPVTLALAVRPDVARSVPWKAGWTTALAVQLTAMVLTFSRGPWVGLGVALVGFMVLVLACLPRRCMLQALALLGTGCIAAAIAAGALPARPVQDADELTPERRLASIYPDVAGGGLNNRLAIWRASLQVVAARPWVPFASLPLPWVRPVTGYGPELYRYVFPLRATAESLGRTGLPSYAHNFFVHELVELGYLGALAWAAVIAALLFSAGQVLLRRKGALAEWRKLAVVAIAAATAGRVVEQMTGIAQAGDLTLFWALLGAGVALAPAAGPDPCQTAPMPGQRLAPARLALALAVAVAVLGLAWTRGIAYARADMAAAAGLGQRDAAEALALTDRAIGLAPDVASYYLQRADLLESLASLAQDVEARAGFAEEAYASALLAYRADPLSVVTRMWLARTALGLARLGYEGKSEEALRLYQELVAMAPGLTQLHALLAVAYIEQGRPSEGLEVLDRLLALDLEAEERAQALYLKGAAYKELGMVDTAVQSLQQSLQLPGDAQVTAAARSLLAELQGN